MSQLSCCCSILQLLLLLLIFVVQPSPSAAAVPCESADGSGNFLLSIQFTESFGAGDHLEALGEERSLSQIYGRARLENDTISEATNDTVTLRLADAADNTFYNGTAFSAVDTYFDLKVESDTGYVLLKQGIDREILSIIYTAETPAGESRGSGHISFIVECTPDDSAYSARNFTVTASIIDVNDNRPLFYDAATNLTRSSFTGSVVDGTPANVQIFQGVFARDLDEGSNAASRISAATNPHFYAVATGAASEVRLYTRRRVDYESFGTGSPTVDVVLTAIDSPLNGSWALTSTATVAIAVSKDPDPPPQFVVPGCLQYSAVCVSPTYTTGVVRGLNTTDGPLDIKPGPILAVNSNFSSTNFSIRYSLVAGEFTSRFWIDEHSGQVTQLQAIDRQTNLVVKAAKWTNESGTVVYSRYSLALLIVSVEEATTTGATTTDGTTTSTGTTETPSSAATSTMRTAGSSTPSTVTASPTAAPLVIPIEATYFLIALCGLLLLLLILVAALLCKSKRIPMREKLSRQKQHQSAGRRVISSIFKLRERQSNGENAYVVSDVHGSALQLSTFHPTSEYNAATADGADATDAHPAAVATAVSAPKVFAKIEEVAEEPVAAAAAVKVQSSADAAPADLEADPYINVAGLKEQMTRESQTAAAVEVQSSTDGAPADLEDDPYINVASLKQQMAEPHDPAVHG